MSKMDEYLTQFDELFQWAETMQKQILEVGEPINYHDRLIASIAGISDEEKVRILYVDEIALPDIGFVNDLKKANILGGFKTAGMVLGHSILLDKNATHEVLIHEFRHVAQYELFADLKSFLTFYLRELIKFGYGNGPLESDAISFTKRFAYQA